MAEEARNLPALGVNLGIQVVRQHAGDVVCQAAASDVGHAADPPGFHKGHDLIQVAAMHRQQRCTDGFSGGGKHGIHGAVFHFEKHLAGKGIAVGVQTAGGQGDQRVALGHVIELGKQIGFIHQAHDGARHIHFAGLINAGHLRHFAADKRACRGFAGFRHALDDLFDDFGFEFLRGDVVQEKQRPCALHQDVVDAVVHQILAHGVPSVGKPRDFHLGAHTIHGAHQYGPGLFELRREKPTEKPQIAQHAWRFGGLHMGLDATQCIILAVDVHTGGGIGNFARIVFRFTHGVPGT